MPAGFSHRSRESLVRPGSAPRAARGFSLLEVLVAIVVLSFGVLGVVGLQAAALQANKEARFQSAAVRLARELSDLMRGNYAAAAAPGNAYLNAYTSWTPTPAYTANCYSQVCSASAIAPFQKFEWSNRVAAELPGALVEVCFDDTTGATQWGCSNTGTVVYIKLGWVRQSTNRAASAPEQAASRPLVVMPVIPQ